MDNYRTIGNKLLLFRKRMGLTQAEVAEKAGISDRTYADIERGMVNMRIYTLLQICHVLHVTPNEILLEDSYKSKINMEELMERLNSCTQKEKDIICEIINILLNGLQ